LKTVAIVQARMGSTRLPNKVMSPVCGTPLIGLLLGRLSKSRRLDQIVLATSTDPRNDSLSAYAESIGYSVFRGSENDVLDRYYQAALKFSAQTVVRVTGDCPLIDPGVVNSVIELYSESAADYASNIAPPTFPDGLDTEAFGFSALELAWKEASEPRQREHVTPFIRESSRYVRVNFANSTDESAQRWTVDEPEDLRVIERVFEEFHPRRNFKWTEVLALCKTHPEWFESNRHLVRNAGADLNSGQKLWKRAKRVIPGGNMLLSKRPEMFLPD
jgi:glutamate-1-semialdehyde 2,1-aminomutase